MKSSWSYTLNSFFGCLSLNLLNKQVEKAVIYRNIDHITSISVICFFGFGSSGNAVSITSKFYKVNYHYLFSELLFVPKIYKNKKGLFLFKYHRGKNGLNVYFLIFRTMLKRQKDNYKNSKTVSSKL